MMANDGNAKNRMAKMADSDIDSDSDIKKETSPLYYHIGGEAKKKFLCRSLPWQRWQTGNNDFRRGNQPQRHSWHYGKSHTTGIKKRVYGNMTHIYGIYALSLQRKQPHLHKSHEKTTNACQPRPPVFNHSRAHHPHVFSTDRQGTNLFAACVFLVNDDYKTASRFPNQRRTQRRFVSNSEKYVISQKIRLVNG